MIEVNFQCRPCRPFSSDAPCVTCLESQLEFAKYQRDLKELFNSDVEDDPENLVSVFGQLETAETDGGTNN